MCKIPCLLGLVKGNTLGSLGAGGGGGGPADNDGGSPSFLNGPPVTLAPPPDWPEKEASSLV